MILIGVAAWSIVPPYLAAALGAGLEVSSRVEVVDHVVPGVLAALAGTYALVLARRGDDESLRALGALGVCALAGLWETATHAPLVLDAGAPGTPIGTVILHASPGPVLVVLALWLLLSPPKPAGIPEGGRGSAARRSSSRE